MKTIHNKTSSGREIAETGDVVESGGNVEVPDDLAESLLRQPDVWGEGSASKAKTADNKSEDA